MIGIGKKVLYLTLLDYASLFCKGTTSCQLARLVRGAVNKNQFQVARYRQTILLEWKTSTPQAKSESCPSKRDLTACVS